MKAIKNALEEYTLEKLLPHRSPMLLLDKLLSCSLERTEVQVLITKDSAFYSNEYRGVPLWVGIEYMAQAIGVWEGFRKLSNKESIRAAFLLAARDYRATCLNGDHFPLNGELTVSVTPNFYDEEKRLGVFDCTIVAKDVNCSARINAYSPLEPETFVDMLRSDTAG
jgi:predicted hotdog family 3-hydroxylacyl-ACP dehydratase